MILLLLLLIIIIDPVNVSGAAPQPLVSNSLLTSIIPSFFATTVLISHQAKRTPD